jgi:glutamate/aspartate transport system substrate-binding protein
MKKQYIAAAVTLAISSFAFAQATDTLAKVKASGEVTMGVRDSSGALSYTLGEGKYTGYHVEICQAILANLEKAVGKKIAIKYQSVTSQNRIPLVQNGTVDIECGSTTNNATRQKDVAFANTTFVEEVRIAVKGNSGITSIAQLNGKNVATTTGTTSEPTPRLPIWFNLAQWPSCMTNGSCNPSPQRMQKWAWLPATTSRLLGLTPTTSLWKTTLKSKLHSSS